MKRVVWENIRGPRAWTATVVATALGAGLIPLAPGTWGSLIALPLVYGSAEWHWAARLILWTFLAIAGIWAAKTFDEVMRTGDNQSIVIDEVVGLGITAWTAGNDLKTLIVAFVLFRAFDILKPPPIRQIDRWSKKKAEKESQRAAKTPGHGQYSLQARERSSLTLQARERSSSRVSSYWGGFGVMADDLLAGFFGLAVVALLQQLHVLG